MNRSRLATPLALLTAAVVFIGAFLATRSLLWSPLLAAVASIGVYMMLDDRSAAQVRDSEYAEDADRKADEALLVVRKIKSLLNGVNSPTVKHSLQEACEHVPELLTRVKQTSPNSLYSTASQLAAHLSSLEDVVEQYLDIQRKPAYYREPLALMASGEQAISRFTEFTIDSLRLVNQGDIAQYQANLATVAPPKLPELGADK